MKKITKVIAAGIASLSLAALFVSCPDPKGGNSSDKCELPKNVGIDELKGTAWDVQIDDYEPYLSKAFSIRPSFTEIMDDGPDFGELPETPAPDDLPGFTDIFNGLDAQPSRFVFAKDGKEITIYDEENEKIGSYRYTYNSEKKVINFVVTELNFTEVDGTKVTLKSASDFSAYISKAIDIYLDQMVKSITEGQETTPVQIEMMKKMLKGSLDAMSEEMNGHGKIMFNKYQTMAYDISGSTMTFTEVCTRDLRYGADMFSSEDFDLNPISLTAYSEDSNVMANVSEVTSNTISFTAYTMDIDFATFTPTKKAVGTITANYKFNDDDSLDLTFTKIPAEYSELKGQTVTFEWDGGYTIELVEIQL